MNYIKESPFNNLDILEYRNLDENNYERVSTIDVNTKTKESELIFSYSYEILVIMQNVLQ